MGEDDDMTRGILFWLLDNKVGLPKGAGEVARRYYFSCYRDIYLRR